MPFAPPLKLYLLREGQSVGPFEPEMLRGYLRTGEVVEDDWVWYHGCEEWMRLGDLAGFRKESPAPVVEIEQRQGYAGWGRRLRTMLHL